MDEHNEPDSDDPLSAAKGIACGLLVAVGFWLLMLTVGILVAVFTRAGN